MKLKKAIGLLITLAIVTPVTLGVWMVSDKSLFQLYKEIINANL